MRKEFSAICLLLTSFLLFPAMAKAAVFTVTRSDDRNNMTCVLGDCSLREAIKNANNAAGSDTINFAAGVTSIPLTSALPDVSSTVSIQGGSGVTVSGNKTISTFRPFHVVGVGNLTLDKITVRNGKETVGGGLWNEGATATLTNCTFTGNEATTDAGGIYNTGSAGTMTISNSVITVNSAVSNGGGIRNGGTLTIIESTVGSNSSNVMGSTLANSNGGGIYNVGFLTVIRSTVSGNITAGNGGGIHNSAVSAVKIINSTISSNSAFQGTGGGVYDIGAGTTVTNATIASNVATVGSGFYNESSRNSFLRNTIVADNTGGASTSDVFGPFNNSFNNLIGKSDNSTGLVNGANGNIVGTIAAPVDPMIMSLANNGGATQTHKLKSGSQAINAGGNALALDENNQPLTTDQRGAGFPRINDGTVDIGAFESSSPTAASVSIGGQVTTATGRGVSSARIVLTDSRGNQSFAMTNPFGFYRFKEVPAGETYIVEVKHKRYVFAAQVVSLTEDFGDLNFTAQP
ncbi:MAG: choice-of-anchor Q domain-containing protein [Pyrinomonadaceae bacterium]